MDRNLILAGLLALGVPLTGWTQLTLGIKADRETYLLFEPILFTVNLTNTSVSPVALNDHPVTGRPWLTFQIFRADGTKVQATGQFSVPPQVLRPGESTSMEVNITPLYAIRDTGPYTIRGVVTMAGRKSFQTGQLRFIVGKGDESWSEERTINGNKRRYALIRFLGKDTSSLYLRVEEPESNLVYVTQKLGSLAGYTRPQVLFDSRERIHVLHISSGQMHRYSRLGPDGRLLYQEDREGLGTTPRLVNNNGGMVQLVGGLNTRDQPKRRRLSEDQQGL